MFYIKVDEKNVIRDAITYEHPGYIPYDVPSVPVGINGGWFKYENGVAVEYPELKPKDVTPEIDELRSQVANLTAVIDAMLGGTTV
ncbi:MAG: hypothetical protein GT601_17565 [Acidaminobacter sp.]|uniref:hypothetical protein n=1 Tax=Acidaminobacter sp. TaxID=1872102 RepID=UPI001382F013|nr:hypothetical protein [Acidaminobacter sp.]MZQ99478.1 hypothetical protein [Acidaminobacter sp.]